MSNGDFEIGAASHNKKYSGGSKFVWAEDNKDNVYRVLPPMFSQARTGKYGVYHQIHRGIRGTDGKQRAFHCPEETDRKTKLITKHCALCDRVRELEAQLKEAGAKGASKEQMKDFRVKYIMPIQNERKYYLNAVNQANDLVVLTIGSKHFQALKAKCDEYDKKGTDIVGQLGYFLNFKKLTQFKGDKQAVLQVEMYIQDINGAPSYATHQITAEFVEKLKTGAADLGGTLFKDLSDNEISTLAAMDDAGRSKLIDTLFARPDAGLAPTTTSIPGTSAVQVSQSTLGASGLQQTGLGQIPSQAQLGGTQPLAPTPTVSAPVALAPASVAAPVATPPPGVNPFAPPINAMPAATTPAPALTTPAPSAPLTAAPLQAAPLQAAPLQANPLQTGVKVLSDAEFANMFAPTGAGQPKGA